MKINFGNITGWKVPRYSEGESIRLSFVLVNNRRKVQIISKKMIINSEILKYIKKSENYYSFRGWIKNHREIIKFLKEKYG